MDVEGEIVQDSIRYKFDLAKRLIVIAKRGIDIREAVKIFLGFYIHEMSVLYPEQARIIGNSDGQLITLVTEDKADDIGPYIWLVSAWKASPSERKLYENG